MRDDPALKSCQAHWRTFVCRPAACLWSSQHYYRALSRDGAPTCGLLMRIHWHVNLVQLVSTHISERYLVQWALYRHYFMHIYTHPSGPRAKLDDASTHQDQWSAYNAKLKFDNGASSISDILFRNMWPCGVLSVQLLQYTTPAAELPNKESNSTITCTVFW